MSYWRRLFLIYQIFLINLVGLTQAQPDLLGHFCNHTSNSIYQANLNNLLSSLSTKTDQYGFYSASLGEDPDTAHAIVLCRADADLDTCRGCIDNSTSKLTQLCPNAKEAIGWYDYCMLRYSNVSMQGIMAGDPRIFVWDDENVTSVRPFIQALTTLLEELRVQAASGGTRRKFATGSTLGPDSVNIYALVQCTPDISQQDCTDCLQGATDNIPLCCNGTKGGRVIRPSCHFRYESADRFFRDIPAASPGTKQERKEGNRTNKSRTVIIIVFPILSTLLLLVLAFSLYQSRKKHAVKKRFGSNVKYDSGLMRSVAKLFKVSRQRGVHRTGEEETQSQSVESLKFDFATLTAATNGFSSANMLGHGGFGSVGYMPPEYANYEKFSVKTDVFSFGVLILEIVSGKKNSGFRGPEHAEHLISYAWKKWRQGKASRLIDPTIKGGSKGEQTRCIHIGLLCVQENVAKRPTMDLVVLMLNSFSMSLQSPTKPAFLMDSSSSEPNTALPDKFPIRVTSSDQSPKHSVNLSVNEASITDPSPR
ncbi:cysteine-rich receptor-like protein kinase 29 [Actinidia eriantha]|uniref:cysteine-rich receptor-like protein kinase 29 n=1 Tax=Actinidia eriantha TaxID=165200 RepID=UPI00258DD83D|nr:cysteine-rich receptor-like protein kinase 29 [Actinidia eriantha]